MKQEFSEYKDEDFLVWKTLFERQQINLSDKACSDYLLALGNMSDVLNANSIPKFTELNEWFQSTTGWEIVRVPGLIPVDEFFNFLAQKKFCSSTWLRTMEQLDYLEEPDMFHDIYGHTPLLSNEVFSDFAHEFGKLGKSFIGNEEKLIMLQRLYWFTIEFGLIEQSGLKIYGAGIASSYGESISSLQGGTEKIVFDVDTIINQPFKNDEVQSKYFVIDSFEQLFDSVVQLTKNWK
ncbi:MAG: phenylalanine-4-hydroxylase [Salibacteraceae bacterium]|jgi:phenylalanine-4-hydroxylase